MSDIDGQLGINSIEVTLNTSVLRNDWTERSCIQWKQEWGKGRALSNNLQKSERVEPIFTAWSHKIRYAVHSLITEHPTSNTLWRQSRSVEWWMVSNTADRLRWSKAVGSHLARQVYLVIYGQQSCFSWVSFFMGWLVQVVQIMIMDMIQQMLYNDSNSLYKKLKADTGR